MASFSILDYTNHEWLDYGKAGEQMHMLKSRTRILTRCSDGNIYSFRLEPGFQTDGGSVPKPFRWLIPSWDAKNKLLCLAYALHDACYGSECLPKDLADDLVRSLLRDSGMARVKAGMVHQAVNLFASKHYGKANDKWNCAAYVGMIKYPSATSNLA